jgi:hypothetical protein
LQFIASQTEQERSLRGRQLHSLTGTEGSTGRESMDTARSIQHEITSLKGILLSVSLFIKCDVLDRTASFSHNPLQRSTSFCESVEIFPSPSLSAFC